MNGKYVKAAIIPAKSKTTVGDIVWTKAILVSGATDEKPDGTKTDARLGSATFNGLTNPFKTFSPSVIGYYTTAMVEETSVGYSFAPKASDATVRVTLNGVEIPASGTADLINSRNEFIVKVTAAGGVAVKTYSFMIRQGDVLYVPPTEDEEPEPDPNAGNTEDPTDDNDGLPTGAIIAIVAGSVVVGGAGIFALVWFVIKKKTWAEFLAIFKKK
jgi:hypothetical protein